MKLSVVLITFQNVETAGEALDGVLMQHTDFPFDIVVGDDASTDGTQDLLVFYRASHPDRIKLNLRKENAGDFGLTNFVETLDAAEGEYIALLDGDDYWTTADKLQKQVEFLDAHPECAICAHRVDHLHTNGARILSAGPSGGTGTYPVGDLIRRNFAPKISTVVRKSALTNLPDWFRTTTVASADWVMNVVVSRDARIGYIDEVMGVHRVHANSVSAHHGAERLFADKLKILPVLKKYVPSAAKEVARAERTLRVKRFVAGISPRGFSILRRIDGLSRRQHGDQNVGG